MWETGETLNVVEGFAPQPALGDGTDRQAQAKLTDYLTRPWPLVAAG